RISSSAGCRRCTSSMNSTCRSRRLVRMAVRSDGPGVNAADGCSPGDGGASTKAGDVGRGASWCDCGLIRGNGRERCGRMLPQVGCGEANADTVASQGIEQSPFAIGKG